MNHEHMQDGTLLFYRKNGGQGPAVLILPDEGETIRDTFYLQLQGMLPAPSYAIELRGHGQSLGTYTRKGHWDDIQYWVMLLKKRHGELYVVAKGVSASLLLQYEDLAHYQRDIPPLPDGMVLLSPVFEDKKHGFALGPVRTQTPTRVFIPQEDFTTAHLRMLFGNCITFKMPHPLSRVDVKVQLKRFVEALADVQGQERPIHFRSVW